MTENNSFKEYRLLILNDLQRLNESMTKIETVVSALITEVSGIKTVEKIRSMVYGGVAGFFGACILIIIKVLLEQLVGVN